MYTCKLVNSVCMVGYLQISVIVLWMCQCLCFFIYNFTWLWCHFVGIVFNFDNAMSRHRGCVLVASNYTADRQLVTWNSSLSRPGNESIVGESE